MPGPLAKIVLVVSDKGRLSMTNSIAKTITTAAIAVTLGMGAVSMSSTARADDFRGSTMHDGGMRGGDRMGGDRMRGGRGMAGGLAAGLLGGLIVNAISTAYIEDSTDHNSETCVHVGACHVHVYDDGAGTKTVTVVKPPKLHRTNCKNGRCTPTPYGNYQLWTYEDANHNTYAQITDQNGNPVNTGAPGGQIGVGGTTYTIIK